MYIVVEELASDGQLPNRMRINEVSLFCFRFFFTCSVSLANSVDPTTCSLSDEVTRETKASTAESSSGLRAEEAEEDITT
jgi:hypothetical protein